MPRPVPVLAPDCLAGPLVGHTRATMALRGSKGGSSLVRNPLLLASALLVSLNGLHGLGHVRQGLGRLSSEVLVGGQALLLLALLPLVLSVRRHRLAPLAAATVGLWTAFAVAASHLAPHWSAFSDPYADNDLDVFSWSQMLLLIAGAAMLGVVGIKAIRRRRAELAGAPRSEAP